MRSMSFGLTGNIDRSSNGVCNTVRGNLLCRLSDWGNGAIMGVTADTVDAMNPA